MPTILDVTPSSLFPAEYEESLSLIKCSGEAVTFLKSLANKNKGYSWVGTSKVLHFICPQVFPIWDGRVANCFGLRSHQIRTVDVYVNYVEAMHCMISHQYENDLSPKISSVTNRVSSEFGYAMTEVRALEFILFSCGDKE